MAHTPGPGRPARLPGRPVPSDPGQRNMGGIEALNASKLVHLYSIPMRAINHMGKEQVGLRTHMYASSWLPSPCHRRLSPVLHSQGRKAVSRCVEEAKRGSIGVSDSIVLPAASLPPASTPPPAVPPLQVTPASDLDNQDVSPSCPHTTPASPNACLSSYHVPGIHR